MELVQVKEKERINAKTKAIGLLDNTILFYLKVIDALLFFYLY